VREEASWDQHRTVSDDEPHRLSAIESPIVVVSNRGPVSFERTPDGSFVAERGAGGLVTALSGVFYRDEATWVAAAMTEADREVPEELSVDATDLRLRYVDIDPDVYDGYYNGIANGVLWFTHHFLWDIPREPEFDEETDLAWQRYVEANQAFASTLHRVSPRDAVFLVQDYHLSLVPAMLRELRADARILHFSHIPFAGQTYLKVLPTGMRETLLRGIAAADVVAFQARSFGENFLLSLRGLPGFHVDLRRWRVDTEDHIALVRAFPVAVSAEPLRELASRQEVREIRRSLKEDLGDRRLLLRVDRLEPSKNILRGFHAFELFLELYPEWRGRVKFLSLLTPSREDLAAYRTYGEECLAEAERINEVFGDDRWTPLEVRVQHDMDWAAAAYGLYDTLLVNPVFDGMNLVAMEGPLLNRNRGVLVLSRNAGSYGRLGRQALGVNPFDIRETAEAIRSSFEMDVAERTRRARGLARTVLAHTPAAWLHDQLSMLDRVSQLRQERTEESGEGRP
jgi:trehalose 6-phosphate synthase